VKRLVVDGNDGTGKSTLARALAERGLTVEDRGVPTKMTDDPQVAPDPEEFYVILDAPVEVCRERLLRAGKNLDEAYHTVEDLTFYRQRFLEVAAQLDNCILIDAGGSADVVLAACRAALARHGFSLSD
jgi:thymidylate kinase